MLPEPWQEFLNEERQQRDELNRQRSLVSGESADRIHLQRDGRDLISFASNDYLGLASHPALRQAASEAAKGFGVGSGASRLITGTHDLHAKLEARLAEVRSREAALAFTTGYQTNVGLVSALAEGNTLIFSDALNHASLIDGCKLAKSRSVSGRVHVYPHLDYDALDQALAEATADARKLIISDSLFSIDGDLADCARLAELARQYDALLVIDDAHAFGVLGRSGRGVPELQGVNPSAIHLITGTFSKALGSLGGYVCCDEDMHDHLLNSARSFIFSTAASLPDTAAAMAALEILESDQGADLRERVLALAAQVRKALAGAGYETSGEAQIVPIWMGEEQAALDLHVQLLEQGYLVPAIRPPTVPEGRSMLRISLSAAHSDDEVTGLINALVAD